MQINQFYRVRRTVATRTYLSNHETELERLNLARQFQESADYPVAQIVRPKSAA
jgi:hypothetical protein